jgi:predicted DNA-binding WGR domain protein
MDIDRLQRGFTYLLLERVNPEKNENRFYYLAWQPSLFEDGAVVRSYGRKDGHRRTLTPLPYPSLDEAWPLIRAILRRRLRHGYKIVEPRSLVEQPSGPESPL